MTDLKHWLKRSKHISNRPHCDDLPIMNELHLLMKGRRDDSSSMNPKSAQVKECRNPQNLEHNTKCSWTYQSAHDLPLSAIICSNCLSRETKV